MNLALCTRVGGLALVVFASVMSAMPAHGAPAAPVPASTTQMTDITFTIANCEGCIITPMTYRATKKSQLNTGRNLYKWNTGQPQVSATVAEGRAMIQVPTIATRGMTFDITDPRDAVDPTGVSGQDQITMSILRDSFGARPNACWNKGTQASEVTLNITHERVRIPLPTNPKGKKIPVTLTYLTSIGQPNWPSGRQESPVCLVR